MQQEFNIIEIADKLKHQVSDFAIYDKEKEVLRSKKKKIELPVINKDISELNE